MGALGVGRKLAWFIVLDWCQNGKSSVQDEEKVEHMLVMSRMSVTSAKGIPGIFSGWCPRLTTEDGALASGLYKTIALG